MIVIEAETDDSRVVSIESIDQLKLLAQTCNIRTIRVTETTDITHNKLRIIIKEYDINDERSIGKL